MPLMQIKYKVNTKRALKPDNFFYYLEENLKQLLLDEQKFSAHFCFWFNMRYLYVINVFRLFFVYERCI